MVLSPLFISVIPTLCGFLQKLSTFVTGRVSRKRQNINPTPKPSANALSAKGRFSSRSVKKSEKSISNLFTNYKELKMQCQVFKNDLGQIRVVGDKNNPLFCLRDICGVLGLESVNKVANAIKAEFELGGELNSTPLQTKGGMQYFTMITEPQLYFLLMRSDKPKAKPFRQWVTSEVLPCIRKTGSYTASNVPALPRNYKEALQHLIVQVEKNEKLQEENERLLKSDARLKTLMHSDNTYLSTTIAKELGLNSAKELHDILHRVGVIFKRDRAWLPYAKYARFNLIESKSEVIKMANGSKKEVYSSRWTQSGREFLLREWNKIIDYYTRRLKNERFIKQMD